MGQALTEEEWGHPILNPNWQRRSEEKVHTGRERESRLVRGGGGGGGPASSWWWWSGGESETTFWTNRSNLVRRHGWNERESLDDHEERHTLTQARRAGSR